MPGQPSDWLYVTLAAVREAMTQRLGTGKADPEAEREMRMALEMLDLMWNEIVGQRESLHREHRRFEDFFEFAPDAYAVTDAGGNLRDANLALADLLGTARDTLLGKPITTFVRTPDRAAFLARFVGLAMNPEAAPLSWQCELQPPAGDPCRVTVSVRAIPLRKSGVAGLCWLFRPAG
jgi:PAS domain S-box-containing protein